MDPHETTASRAALWLGAPAPRWASPLAIGDLVLASFASAMIAAGGVAALGLDAHAWAAPFVAQDSGQRPLLVLRVGVALLALARVRAIDRAHTIALSAIVALFAVSLVARGLLVPGVVVSALLIHRYGDRAAAFVPSWVVAAALCLPVLALIRTPSRAIATEPAGEPRDVVAAWRARGNLFRAHAVALEWAKRESPPSEGHLALAELDHAIGHATKAQKVLTKILANPASDAVRRAALEDERAWSRESSREGSLP